MESAVKMECKPFDPKWCHRSCCHFAKKPQKIFFESDGRTHLKDPRIEIKDFCGAYGLHVEWVKQIICDPNGKCYRYECDD